MTKQVLEGLYCTETPATEERSFMFASEEKKMTNTIHSFRDLPRKTCTDCGSEIIEQEESHLFQCEKCLRHCDS